MSELGSLESLSQQFAEKLTNTLQETLGDGDPFSAKSIDNGSRFVVEQTERHGVPLKVNGTPLLSLKIKFDCRLDDEKKFLAIDKSSIKVFGGSKAAGEPLFRYEYEREPIGNIPVAHIHVHAHRDAFTASMVRAGITTTRALRRARNTDVPTLSELHFPVGGHRFRPILEDVLEMLIEEFGIDHAEGFRAALQDGRREWRMKQTKAAVRDDPDSAVAMLKDMGYTIQFESGGTPPGARNDRLEQL